MSDPTDTRPLRVLYSFPHPLGAPGIGTTALNQVEGLAARGARVTVCCTSLARTLDPRVEQVVSTLTLAGRRIPHRAFGGMDRAIALHDRRVARYLRRHHDAFDIVHGWPLGSVETFSAARDLGIVALRESPNCETGFAYRRVAEEVASLGLDTRRGSSHDFNPARLAREESEYQLATAVLAPSEPVERSYRARHGSSLRVLRHRYGFDPVDFPAPERDRPRGDSFTMVFVGRCEPRKGVHHALAAWRRSGAAAEGARFVIVGTWDPGYRELLAEDLAAPGVERRDFTDDVSSVLRASDVLVLPSVEEGSALVTYEAQASGCALLVSDAAGALMVDGEQGMTHPAGDVDLLTSQLTRMVEDRALLGSMQRAAVAQRDELSWAAAAQRLEQVYREALTLAPQGSVR